MPAIQHVIVMASSPAQHEAEVKLSRPGAMFPVLGKPLVARVMAPFYRAGVRRFTVIVGEHEGGVALWLSSKWHPDVKLEFTGRGHKRGTAAAVFAAKPKIDGPFIVTSCDVIISTESALSLCRYPETHPRNDASLLLYESARDINEAAGIVRDPMGKIIYISEQPTGLHQDGTIAPPVYGFKPTVLDYLERASVDERSGGRSMAAVIQAMIDDGKPVNGLPSKTPMRIKTLDDLFKVNLQLLKEQKMVGVFTELPRSVKVIPPAHIDNGVTVGEGATIGPNVYLETGTTVGSGSSVKNSVVLGKRVGSKRVIDNQLVIEEQL